MISFIIPVYKNTSLFLKNLQYNLNFMKNVEIIIVNDDPKTDLKTLVQPICPQAIVINNPENLGFGRSVNLGVGASSGEFLFLLNSDVLLLDNKYELAVREFSKNPKLFALSFAQLNDNNELSVANQGDFKEGLFQHTVKPGTTVTETLWPEGGSSLVRREFFKSLGGFDPRFSPFYWEDVDLGYRAWQNGYESFFYPKVVVKHEHSTTINKYYSKERIRAINFRNQLLFTWKNIRGKDLAHHFLLLPLILVRHRQETGIWSGFWLAINSLFGRA